MHRVSSLKLLIGKGSFIIFSSGVQVYSYSKRNEFCNKFLCNYAISFERRWVVNDETYVGHPGKISVSRHHRLAAEDSKFKVVLGRTGCIHSRKESLGETGVVP